MLEIYIWHCWRNFYFSCLSVGFLRGLQNYQVLHSCIFRTQETPRSWVPAKARTKSLQSSLLECLKYKQLVSFVQSATLSATIIIDKHSTKDTTKKTFLYIDTPWHTLTPLKSMTFAEMLGATHLAGNEIVLVEAPMRPGCQEKRFIGQCEKGLGGNGDPENGDQEWLSFVQVFFVFGDCSCFHTRMCIMCIYNSYIWEKNIQKYIVRSSMHQFGAQSWCALWKNPSSYHSYHKSSESK